MQPTIEFKGLLRMTATATATTPEVIGVRRGMFGAKGSGDTSGYGRLVRPVALPGSSPRPYGGYFDEVVDTLAGVLGDDVFAAAVERVVVFRDELTLEVASRALRRGGAGAARRRRDCGSNCASASAACTTPTMPAANCMRSIR